MSRLREYQRKRDFSRTREPAGGAGSKALRRDPVFVVHKHQARQLHYDLRLENEGVLESWAVPKRPSLKVGIKRLAVHVEDHPLEYGDFEGTIPKREYGGGTVMLWDRGTWRQIRRSDGRIDFELDGHRLSGAWTLTRTAMGDDRNNWLLIKRSDPEGKSPGHVDKGKAEDRSVATGRTMEEIADGELASTESVGAMTTDAGDLAGARKKSPPARPEAQLATLVKEVPDGPRWIHEIKFDGYRILASIDHGKARLWSRNGKDWTGRFSRIAAALEKLHATTAHLDGEVVALSADGTSSFHRLQELLSSKRTDGLVYQVFDLTYLDGFDLCNVPLSARKQALSDLLGSSGMTETMNLRLTDHVEGDGREVFDNACRLGLEGIVSKRRDARYRSVRNRHWVKVKCHRHDEFLIGGYTEPGGSRSGFGALMLGTLNDDDELVFSGKVGTGFSQRQLSALHAALKKLEVPDCPFANQPRESRVHWVQPLLVAEIGFSERTRDGRLRHPSFRGLREDKEPEEVHMPQAESVDSRTRKPRSAGRSAARGSNASAVAGVRLTHPERVLYPDQGLTKLELARYYEEIADWILPQLVRRPLSLLRCPEGRAKACFFQKHPGQTMSADIPRVDIREKSGKASYLYVEKVQDIVNLVQTGTLELHTWGCHVDDVEHPDTIVFDLDPGPDVAWTTVLDAARALDDRLQDLALSGFFRTTGGKGLHVVVPIKPGLTWDEAKTFARAVAAAHAADDPKKLTVNMAKSKRKGRIFIDYLRNGRGATAIVSYSTRARAGAPVAVPVRRDELRKSLTSDRYSVVNVRRRLRALSEDPWEDFERMRRPITIKALRAVVRAGGSR